MFEQPLITAHRSPLFTIQHIIISKNSADLYPENKSLREKRYQSNKKITMKVSLDSGRILHLLLLLFITVLAGELLLSWWSGYGRLSAYALSCTVTCQLSNVVMGLMKNNESNAQGGKYRKEKERANPKKKKRTTRLKES